MSLRRGIGVALPGIACYAFGRAFALTTTRGLLPSSMRLAGSAFRATLVRTKTSGSGKKREELYIHVDPGAFIFEEAWLRTGFDLWLQAGTDRDYFLPLPSADFHGFVFLEAQYSDSQACSRALLRMFKTPDGRALDLHARR